MKASWIVIAIVAAFILYGWGGYNSLVSADESVNASWSEVQNQTKRKTDLIPNLVSTVKGYAEHESSVFEEVTTARAKLGQAVNVDVSKLAGDPALQKQLLEASQGLNGALSRLIAVQENYPQLKADQNFRALQDELAGTENRIAVARGRAIDAVQYYDQTTRTFPTNVIASLGKFEHRDYYKMPEGSDVPVVVDFSKKKS